MDIVQQFNEYNEEHCWQYDIRLRNWKKDLEEAGLTEDQVKILSVKDFTFHNVDNSYYSQIKQFIERHEWLGSMSSYPTHYFIAKYEDKLAGALVMNMPNAFSKLLGEGTKDIERLISRGACISWSPKNLGSSLIMWAIKWMVHNTQYRVFTAYSDPMAKELGTIYQACNFIYLGQTSGGQKKYKEPGSDKWVSDRKFRNTASFKRYAREAGIEWQSNWSTGRKVHWENIPDDVEKYLRDEGKRRMAECEVTTVPPKHKYVYILGQSKKETKELHERFRQLNPKLVNLPYPKVRGK